LAQYPVRFAEKMTYQFRLELSEDALFIIK